MDGKQQHDLDSPSYYNNHEVYIYVYICVYMYMGDYVCVCIYVYMGDFVYILYVYILVLYSCVCMYLENCVYVFVICSSSCNVSNTLTSNIYINPISIHIPYTIYITIFICTHYID